MKHRTWISTAFVMYMLASCSFSPPVDTMPKASPEFALQLDRATVPLLIRCGGKTYKASAVIVSRSHLLTAKHAVDCGAPVEEITGWIQATDEMVNFQVDAMDSTADVARLRTVDLSYNLPDVAPSRGPIPARWSIVCTAVALPERRVYCGVVDASVEDWTVISTTGPSYPGNSGGGAYNKRGQLIGLVFGYYSKTPNAEHGEAIIELRIAGMMP